MRLIDADELIKKCESPHWCVWMSEIEDTPTIEAEPKWIPVTERLPEEGDSIIGTYDNGDGHVLVGQSVYLPQLLNKPYPLTAWMPLPPAYKGE